MLVTTISPSPPPSVYSSPHVSRRHGHRWFQLALLLVLHCAFGTFFTEGPDQPNQGPESVMHRHTHTHTHSHTHTPTHTHTLTHTHTDTHIHTHTHTLLSLQLDIRVSLKMYIY